MRSKYDSDRFRPISKSCLGGTAYESTWNQVEVAVRSDLVEKAEIEDGKYILRGVVEAAALGCCIYYC